MSVRRTSQVRRVTPAISRLVAWGGPGLSGVADRMVPSGIEHSLPDVLAWLTDPRGVAVTLACMTPEGQEQGHVLMLAPEHAPPGVLGIASPHYFGALSEEVFLAALVGHAPECLRVLTRMHEVPCEVPPFPSAPTVTREWWQAVKAILVARLWALAEPAAGQVSGTDTASALDRPDDWEIGRQMSLKYGLRPADWEQWVQARAVRDGADKYLLVGATLEQARPWLAAGYTSSAAAYSARADLTPDAASWQDWKDWGQARRISRANVHLWRLTGWSRGQIVPLLRLGLDANLAHRLACWERTPQEIVDMVSGGVALGDLDAWLRVPVPEVLEWRRRAGGSSSAPALARAHGVAAGPVSGGISRRPYAPHVTFLDLLREARVPAT